MASKTSRKEVWWWGLRPPPLIEMKILVPTVHHTGTKTIFNDLLSDYGEINQQNYDCPFDGKLRIHIDKPFLADIKYWLERSVTIVPMRHPRTTAIGWKSRYKSLDWLEQQFNWLKGIVDPFKPYYIPLDGQRDKALLDFNLQNELSLTTNWPVIGQHGDEYLELNEDEERKVKTWMDDGFFDRFGYN